MPFKTGTERLAHFDESMKNPPIPLRYGVKFLDDVTGGIYPDDLVILTARTGRGKTEMLSQIVENSAIAGKTVHMFALEAHIGEIEARIKFRRLSSAFYMCTKSEEREEVPNYQDWKQRRQQHILEKYEEEVNKDIGKFFTNFKTFYTEAGFTVDNFEAEMHRMMGETDLVLLDHLHFMDFEGNNENVEFKKAVKQIKKIVQFWRKPIIVAAQLRKADRNARDIVPSLDDVHGSSDIVKIATHIAAVSPAWDKESVSKNIFPTYFKMLKNRTDGSRTNFVGLCGYDVSRNQYSEYYRVGKLTNDGQEFLELKQEEWPQWARRKKPQNNLQTELVLK